ncbi:MAG TPA: hypothetical protein H9692_03500 [Firmicutes bacterium]|nr:hypothetical protein [Bacillota bacterium]
MKKTVKGKVYDTENMKAVMKKTCGYFGDEAGYEEVLFEAEDGATFLYGKGGSASPYPKEKLTTMSAKKAEAWKSENA